MILVWRFEKKMKRSESIFFLMRKRIKFILYKNLLNEKKGKKITYCFLDMKK